jgi:hypothetical protein
MLDLCSGLGGASAAMRDRDWDVVAVDINNTFNPTYTADVREWSWEGPPPTLVWASPPCIEFSREAMPWTKTGIEPDLSIIEACIRIVNETNPQYFVLENVRGSIKWIRPILGRWRARYGPFFLWGYFPELDNFDFNYKSKESYTSMRKAERAMIPYSISLALALAIEKQYHL